MANQVRWTKKVTEDFIELAMLTEDEEYILRSRIKGTPVSIQADHLCCSDSTVHRIISKWKDEDVLMAKMYADLSTDELKHAIMFHDTATRLINEYRQKGNETPPEMKAVYDYLHEKHMKRFNAIKLQQAMFKGQ